jgi:adenylyltransferase/sulfurtransferase
MNRLPDPSATMEVSCSEVATWATLPENERPRLLDCRQPDEWDICHLDGAQLLPLGDFPSRIEALKEGVERGVVVYCHHGMRSLRATAFLRDIGVENAFSMAGGIDAWSRTVDPDLARY